MRITQSYKKWFFLPFIFLAVLYACTSEQDYQTDTDKPVEPLTVSEAMDWYNASVGMLGKQKSTVDNSDEISYKPFGNLAELFTDELWYAVESPLDFGDRKLTIMTPELRTYTETHGDDAIKQMMKLVVLRNKETGDIYSFIMAVIPEPGYMLRKGDGLNEITYLSRDSDFDGYIFFYTLDGQLINGWLYEKGKLTGGINLSGDEKRTKIAQAMVMEITVCGSYAVDYGGVSYRVDCYTYSQVVYIDNGIYNSPSGGGVNKPEYRPPSGNGPSSNLPLKPLPLDDYEGAEKLPKKRTDCSGSATMNANNAQDAMAGSLNTMQNMNILRGYAQSEPNEWAALIDFELGQYYMGSDLIKGGTGSVYLYPNSNTVYDVHTHTADTREGYNVYTGFSVGDIYSMFEASNTYSNYKGGIVIAYDGSEYLLAVNDRTKLLQFWNNSANDYANRELFKSGDGTVFKNKDTDDEYRDIRRYLESQTYSADNAHDYALSYLLDKYDTGLKISKKEKGESSFKEMKTNTDSSNNYKPTICP